MRGLEKGIYEIAMKMFVLRLEHRRERDRRVGTHCGLVARAFGADGIIYTGEKDKQLKKSLKKVVKNWGGPFSVKYGSDWRKVIKNYKRKNYAVCHLTVYGYPIQDVIKKLKDIGNILVVIGGKKVPAEIYELADYNISITQQPHSEIAALTIFLHEHFRGKELEKRFQDAKIKIIPQEKGKKVVKV